MEVPLGNCSDEKLAEMAPFYHSRFDQAYIEDSNILNRAQCVDVDGLYLESADLFSNFASVRIQFEHCIETNSTECQGMDDL